MCDRCKKLADDNADLEQYVEELYKSIHFIEDGLARALNTDAAGVARFLCPGKRRLIPYRLAESPLNEQLMRGDETTRRLLDAAQARPGNARGGPNRAASPVQRVDWSA